MCQSENRGAVVSIFKMENRSGSGGGVRGALSLVWTVPFHPVGLKGRAGHLRRTSGKSMWDDNA